jgi:hypothetical protein
VSARRDLLGLALSPELLVALDEYIRDVVAEALIAERARVQRGEWVPLTEAATRLRCSYDAVRMRRKRGSIESRRLGGRIYVRVDGTSGG